jgi:GT2 family glycosyltransferase/SAM-dependent methyltransferase
VKPSPGSASGTGAPSGTDIVGTVERPAPADGPAIGSMLQVSGWALSPAGIRSVRVFMDGAEGGAVSAHSGLLRPDVAANFPELAMAARCGYLAVLDISHLATGQHRLQVVASDGAGRERRWVVPVSRVSATLADTLVQWRRVTVGPGPWTKDAAAAQRARALRIGVIVRVSSAATLAGLWISLAALRAQRHAPGAVVVWWDVAADCPITGAVRTLQAALQQCPGDWIALLDSGVSLLPDALQRVAGNVVLHPLTPLFYGDHREAAMPHGDWQTVSKPSWGPAWTETARGCALVGPFFVDKAHAQGVAGTAAEGAASLLFHRLALASPTVGHVPDVLSQCHGSNRVGPIDPGPAVTACTGSDQRQWPSLAIIIPTCLADRAIVARCLTSLHALLQTHGGIEVLVVVNNVSDVDDAHQFLSRWDVQCCYLEGAFNWSALNNAAAARASGDDLLFLNDDVEALDLHWLDALRACALDPTVGAVGAVLKYPSGRIQHAGVHLQRVEDRIEARHTFRFCRGDEPWVAPWLGVDLDHTAVTGACLLTHRRTFLELGGFDESLTLVFNDVDYCLRLAERGLRCVVASRASLVHHEGLSRLGMSETEDTHRFNERWLQSIGETDPFYNPNLRHDRDDWVPNIEQSPLPCARLSVGGRVGTSSVTTDTAWQEWGKQDPYFGVITDPKYRSGNLTEAAKNDFFASGHSHVRHVLSTCRSHARGQEFQPRRVLDFGCGVGRLLVAFAQQVDLAVGLDVSEGMLDEARRNCEIRGLGNVTLVRSDDTLSALEGTFDLVHSSIVFQHIDVPRGRQLFKLLVQRLAPGGMGALHMTYGKRRFADNWGQPKPATADRHGETEGAPASKPRGLLKLLPFTRAESVPAGSDSAAETRLPNPPRHTRGADPEMQMNTYNMNELLFMLQESGVRSFHTDFTDHGGELGVMFYFQRPA